MDFDKKILFDNINYLIKKKDIKIGELEEDSGVSPGYISRASKEGGSKPGIDFIVGVAKQLEFSIDTLVNVPLSEATPTEEYLIKFINKLYKDTVNYKLDWEREKASFLNSIESDLPYDSGHPIFSIGDVTIETTTGEFREVTKSVFESDTYGFQTEINGDCFNLRMKNGNYLYVMNVGPLGPGRVSYDAQTKELWLHTVNDGLQFLCSSKNNTFEDILEGLYSTIDELNRIPNIKGSTKYIIDSFMDDDLNDDPPADIDFDETPF